MSGDSDSDGATTLDISAVLTMSDDSSSNYTVNFFSTSIQVLNCTPSFEWLDTANATEFTILSAQSVTVTISS